MLFLQYVVPSSQTSSTASSVARPTAGRQRPVRLKHPQFAELQQRKASFQGKRVPAGQRVDVLALAGFFHVGESQQPANCVSCEIRLNVTESYSVIKPSYGKFYTRNRFQTESAATIIIRRVKVTGWWRLWPVYDLIYVGNSTTRQAMI